VRSRTIPASAAAIAPVDVASIPFTFSSVGVSATVHGGPVATAEAARATVAAIARVRGSTARGEELVSSMVPTRGGDEGGSNN
jgi:hypothetical protein